MRLGFLATATLPRGLSCCDYDGFQKRVWVGSLFSKPILLDMVFDGF